MSSAQQPVDVLVVGGGVAALEATLALQSLTNGTADVVVLAPEPEFTYRPLAFAAPFGAGEASRFPLERLVTDAGARLHEGAVARVDAERHVVVTADGKEISYRVCLLALGASPHEAVPGAITFAGPGDEDALRDLLADARTDRLSSLAVVVPAGVGWPLPAYELALLLAAHASDAGADVGVELITPESTPLAVFGGRASDAIRELLGLRGITLRTETTPVAFEKGRLAVAPKDIVYVDRVIAMPRLEGPHLPGVPCDSGGFIPTDEYGAVVGVPDVFAAGDATTFPVKQGGIAAQQADAAADAIAARIGVDLDPQPFEPVLRGLLLTGLSARFLRAESQGRVSTIDTEPLWWPPAKIVGRYFAPFLARHVGLAEPPDELQAEGLRVEVELDPRQAGTWTPV